MASDQLECVDRSMALLSMSTVSQTYHRAIEIVHHTPCVVLECIGPMSSVSIWVGCDLWISDLPEAWDEGRVGFDLGCGTNEDKRGSAVAS